LSGWNLLLQVNCLYVYIMLSCSQSKKDVTLRKVCICYFTLCVVEELARKKSLVLVWTLVFTLFIVQNHMYCSQCSRAICAFTVPIYPVSRLMQLIAIFNRPVFREKSCTLRWGFHILKRYVSVLANSANIYCTCKPLRFIVVSSGQMCVSIHILWLYQLLVVCMWCTEHSSCYRTSLTMKHGRLVPDHEAQLSFRSAVVAYKILCQYLCTKECQLLPFLYSMVPVRLIACKSAQSPES